MLECSNIVGQYTWNQAYSSYPYYFVEMAKFGAKVNGLVCVVRTWFYFCVKVDVTSCIKILILSLTLSLLNLL